MGRRLYRTWSRTDKWAGIRCKSEALAAHAMNLYTTKVFVCIYGDISVKEMTKRAAAVLATELKR